MESSVGRFARQVLVPIVIIVACIVGGLFGAWGLPRALLVSAPHAPTWLVYASSVAGILAGGVAGLALAEIVVRGFSALSRGSSHS